MRVNDSKIFDSCQCPDCLALVWKHKRLGILLDCYKELPDGGIFYYRHVCMKQKCFPVRGRGDI